MALTRARDTAGSPFHRLWRGMGALLFPESCVSCRAFLPDFPDPARADWPLCEPCLQRIETLTHNLCLRCGRLSLGDELCLNCLSGTTPTRFPVRASARYGGPMRDLVTSAKPPRREDLARRLGHLLTPLAGPFLIETGTCVVVPVPLYAARLKARGYSLPDRLAHTLARDLRLAYKPEWLARTRDTPSQVGRTPEERLQNVADAFAAFEAPEDMSGLTVLLVDDVVTTGATLAHAAEPLLMRGAQLVGLALARA